MSRCVYYFHVVWATQYRLEVLTGEREEAVYRLIVSLARDVGAEIIAVNGMPDHIHILMKTGAIINTPDIMKKLKGATSAMLNREPNFQGRFRWQEGYYSVTVSPLQMSKVKAYIHGQKEHHANGTTHEFLERTQDPEEDQ